MTHTVLDLCAGIGGFHLGLENTQKYKVKAWCEINEHARAVYDHNFPDLKNWTDITQINPTDVPNIDIITAGIPCQSFSQAGHRRGFDDARGTIVYDVLRITKEKMPEYVILENVPGLLTHTSIIENPDTSITQKTFVGDDLVKPSQTKGPKTIDIMTRLFEDIGYTVAIRLLDSSDFVPQHRNRVFVTCKKGKDQFIPPWHPTSTDRRLLRDLLEPAKDIPANLYLTKEQIDKFYNAPKGGLKKAPKDTRRIIAPNKNKYGSRRTSNEAGIAMPLTCANEPSKVMVECDTNTRQDSRHRKLTQLANIGDHQSDRIYDDAMACTQQALGGGGGVKTGKYLVEHPIGPESVRPMLTPLRHDGNYRQNGRRIKNDDDDYFTLTATDRHGLIISADHAANGYNTAGTPYTYVGTSKDPRDYGLVYGYNKSGQLRAYHTRQLTRIEGLRLQGFPDTHFDVQHKGKPLPLTVCQRLVGNAVTVPVVEHIGNLLEW